MICRECQSDNPPAAKTCSHCGISLMSASEETRAAALGSFAAPAEWRPGTVIGDRFEVIERLGRGGMGTVYRAFDRRIHEEIAVKALAPDISTDATMIERFKNELKLARRIVHRNICRLYDLNESDGVLFITMEFVPGEDLKSLIRREGPLPLPRCLSIARSAGEGLTEAHHHGVVHRDLKSQNVMVDKGGGVHLLDFGIARLIGSPDLTTTGAILGTPDYMSPEQVEGRPADQRSDIYSLGVVLFEMVTARLPFQGDTALSVAIKRVNERPPSPRAFNQNVPPGLNAFILRCLDKDPGNRPQTAGELVEHLTLLQSDAPQKPFSAVIPLPDRPGAVPSKKSIAVLSFKDMSPQHDQDYFCEGLAEELINALTQVQGLRVAARTSSFSFKGKDSDIREIGRVLNVETVLEGSVQKSGNTLRVTAQLINIADGYHLWSERFDRKMKDIFAVQDEISLAIVEKLKVGLLAGEKEKITKRHTEDKDAYNMFIKGRYYWNRRFQGDMVKAVVFYEKAIAKDPAYALPYVGIADAFNILGMWAYIHPADASVKSRAALEKALAIDPQLGEAYSSLAYLSSWSDRAYAAAEEHARRSIELSPSYAYAHLWYGFLLSTLRRFDEALAETRKAVELDPLFSLMKGLEGLAMVLHGDVEPGRRILRQAVDMNPAQPMTYLFFGLSCLLPPAIPERAIEVLEHAAGQGLVFAEGWLGLAHAMAGRPEDALNVLARLDRIGREYYAPLVKRLVIKVVPSLRLFRSFKKKYVSPQLRALIYFGLNRQDDALRELEKSQAANDYFLPILLSVGLPELPWRKDFISHPRFKALIRQVGLT